MLKHHLDFVSDIPVSESDDWRTLACRDFEKIIGLSISERARIIIEERDFGYRHLRKEERDGQILKILDILDGPIAVSGPKRQEAWEAGWDQNLNDYLASGYDEKCLLPHYYRRGRTVMRLWDDYVVPRSTHFEADFLSVLQTVIAEHFFKDVPAIYEFGCGPGHNLLAFSHIVPGKQYHGLDWAAASSRILDLADSRPQRDDPSSRFRGHFFDMFHPTPDFRMIGGSAAFTFGSMEQLGTDYRPFLSFLLSQPASVYVHVEPFSEFRRKSLLLDVLADRYARKRNYLDGFLCELQRLEESESVEITHQRKVLGSTFYDGWCLVTWRRKVTR